MKYNLILLRLAAVLMMLSAPKLLKAQQPDIRLSPEPISYVMPADAQIQSAATIGSKTLVVWGTTAFASDNSVVNQLRMQMLEDTLLYGQQRSLHSDSARPYGVVSVLALPDRFLVFWNDRRSDAPGLYLQRVDTNGVFIGDAELFSKGTLISDKEVALLEVNREYLLVWSDGRNGIYARSLTAHSDADGDETLLSSGRMKQALVSDIVPGLTILQRYGGPSVVIPSNGNADTLKLLQQHFSFPYYLGADSSIVELRDTTVMFFRSIFDSIPVRRIAVPAVRAAYRDLSVITRDTTGQFQVVYPEISSVWSEYIIKKIRRVTLSDDSPSEPKTIDSAYTDLLLYSGHVFVNDSISIRRALCNNRWEIVILLSLAVDIPASGTIIDYFRSDGYAYAVGRDGQATLDLLSVEKDSCVERRVMSIAVARTKSDTISSIDLLVDNHHVHLSRQTAFRQQNYVQTNPALLLRNNSLVTTWREMIPRESVNAGIWDGATPIRNTSPLLLPSSHSSFEYYALPGSVISTIRSSSSSYKFASGLGYGWEIDTQYHLYTVTDSVWQEIFTPLDWITFSTSGTDPSDYHIISFGYDPNLQTTVMAINNPAGIDLFVESNPSTMIRWSVPSTVSVASTQLVPIASQEVFACNLTRLTPVTKGGSKKDIILPLASGSVSVDYSSVRYQRLLGNYFLRSHRPKDSIARLILERFDFDANKLDSVQFTLSSSYISTCAIQNTTDSSIAILLGSKQGVRMIYCDKHLQIQRDTILNQTLSDVRVSATPDSVGNPSGTFRNDTLFLVWEDYRNGAPDIYGNYWVVPKTLEGQQQPVDTTTQHQDTTQHPQDTSATTGSSRLQITSIAPNPTRESVSLEYSMSDAGTLSLEIIDAMGRRIEQQSEAVNAGRGVRTLDVIGLAPGTYTVVLRSGSNTDRRRLVVLH